MHNSWVLFAALRGLRVGSVSHVFSGGATYIATIRMSFFLLIIPWVHPVYVQCLMSSLKVSFSSDRAGIICSRFIGPSLAVSFHSELSASQTISLR
jgi:hypothetical protein